MREGTTSDMVQQGRLLTRYMVDREHPIRLL